MLTDDSPEALLEVRLRLVVALLRSLIVGPITYENLDWSEPTRKYLSS